ncbi:hypothetical protein PtA15_14A45 [Puccinia triticina]|uniref:Uncharacterized protein n=1 Tax=Puccinia triticina TaxID=208348 RepID=A0ABY7D1Q8_9BASI|nr:uncharacterized protein PtA15_14A45 [Puccinia triticina]WAQ91165.1 hypothetical protein PtA15_14A45 [Puccinia triticina]
MDPPEYLPKTIPRKATDEEQKKIDYILKNYETGNNFILNKSPYPTLLAKPYLQKEWDFGRVRVYGADGELLHETATKAATNVINSFFEAIKEASKRKDSKRKYKKK